MLASRFGKLALTLALIAFVVIGGVALSAPHAAPSTDVAATTVAGGVGRTVDATIGDSSRTRVSQTERRAPRDDDPYLLPLAVLAIGLACIGRTDNRVLGSAAVAPRRGGSGCRAPPVLVAP